MNGTDYSNWVGRQSSRSEVISDRLLTHFRAVMAGRLGPGEVPPGFHWVLVPDVAQPADLGRDGHPRTGLEVKFSYTWLAGMVLAGIPTASDRAYTDALAQDTTLANFAGRITVAGEAGVTDMQAAGEVRLTDGGTLPFAHDLAARLPGDVLERSLRAKATGLIGAEGEQIWALVAGLDSLSARDLGKALA